MCSVCRVDAVGLLPSSAPFRPPRSCRRRAVCGRHGLGVVRTCTAVSCAHPGRAFGFSVSVLERFRACCSEAAHVQSAAVTFTGGKGATLATVGSDLGVHGLVVLPPSFCASPWHRSSPVRDEIIAGMSPDALGLKLDRYRRCSVLGVPKTFLWRPRGGAVHHRVRGSALRRNPVNS